MNALSEDKGNLQRAIEKHADAKRGAKSRFLLTATMGEIKVDFLVFIHY